jgi:hypothetical protein
MFVPKTLAANSQRHTAASASATSPRTAQQGSACGKPTPTVSNTLAQTLKSGQLGPWAEVRVVKKMMLRERMRMVIMDVTLFEPIFEIICLLSELFLST